MVQDLDPFLRIPADGEVINEQKLDPCIVLNHFTVLAQIFLTVEDNQFIQQIAVVYKLTAVIAPTCFYTTGRQKVGLACASHSIDPDVLPVLSKVEFQNLINSDIIIDTPVTGFQVLGCSAFVDQTAEPQICFKSLIDGFYVLRFQNLTDEL